MKKRKLRKPPRGGRNWGAVELWTPKYRLRVVTDKRKQKSLRECRTLFQPHHQLEA